MIFWAGNKKIFAVTQSFMVCSRKTRKTASREVSDIKTQKFHVVTALTLGLGLLALVVAALSVTSVPSISHAAPLPQVSNPRETESVTVYKAPEENIHVARTGTDTGDCTNSDFPCQTVQYAVDQASKGSVIKVASGTYTGVQGRPASPGYDGSSTITQVVYISKTVTIRGGYTTTNWSMPNPISYPTTLDAQGQGRVLYVSGVGISPIIEGLRITGGDSAGLGGGLGGEAGGGVYVITATVTVSACQIISNTSNILVPFGGDGGGIYLMNSPHTTLSANTIQNNTAWYGGGIYLHSSGNATLINNTIRDNLAHGWYGASGGGVLVQYGANAILTGNTIQGNTSQVGGGVFLIGSDNATLISNTILRNADGGSHTFFEGGGVCLWDSGNAMLIGNTIQGNYSDEGGGVCLRDSNNATLNDNIIQGNLGGIGSGINMYSSNNVTLNDNIIQGNTTYWYASGVWLLDCDNVTLNNNVIADNRGGGAAWGGIYIAGSTAYLRHTTLARNSGGSGLYVTDWSGFHSSVFMTNTILVSHAAGISITAGNTVTLEGTLWGSGAWANATDWEGLGTIITGTSAHNYWGDPAFVNPGAGDYHISSESAAFDAGVDAGVTEDMDGDPRTDGHPDIGADEFQSVLIVTKQASAPTVQPGERLTYTIRVTNTHSADLHVVITDTLPFSVTLGGTLSGTALLPGGTVILPDGMLGITWTASITAPGGVWMGTVVVTVEIGCSGPLTNVVKVSTGEGTTGIYTATSTVFILHPVYLPFVLRNESGPNTIVGEYLFVGNPCTTTPCLPGMVYAVLVNDTTYYPTIEGAWLWDNHSWNGYTPKIGDFVTVTGHVDEMMDVSGNLFYNIQVVSLEPAPQPPTIAWNVVISDILSYGTSDQGSDEYVEIRNDDVQPIQLDGWTLRDASGRVFAFPNQSMNPGQACRVYTNENHPEWCGLSYGSESDVWNYANDCAYLRDSAGALIDVYCYCQSHTAFMTISSTVTTLAVGDVVTVTTVLFNRGCTDLGMPQYGLSVRSDGPEPIFDLSNPALVVHYLGVGLGQSDAAEFVLQAVRPGQATVHATTSFEVHLGYPGPAYWDGSGSGPLVITVTP
ncbi:MAG: DUF11 domain-containing protein [Chloroflexi bacterium]|nr:DUF11 domain-containing protein [Chloroflexota bacterium]